MTVSRKICALYFRETAAGHSIIISARISSRYIYM